MDRQFIECYEEEREVIRKIEELKAKGYAESDMYVLARSSEQLTMIRTRTDVEYHAAEGKGMGRFGMFIRSRHVFPYIMGEDAKAWEIAELYQHLSDGNLLFFYTENSRNSPEISFRSPSLEEGKEADVFSQYDKFLSAPYYMDEFEEDRISIDSMHYETSTESQVQGVKNLENHFIETYNTEDELMRQIEKLKDEGHSESDMYIMAKKDGQVSMVKGKTNIDVQAEQGNWLDRFTTFLTDNKQTDMAFKNMQLTEHEAEAYARELEEGKLLLYANKDYEARFKEAGGDSFKLGEKEKTELQNRKKNTGNSPPPAAEREEKVELEDQYYIDDKDVQLERKRQSDS